jgi:hypothetical protein
MPRSTDVHYRGANGSASFEVGTRPGAAMEIVSDAVENELTEAACCCCSAPPVQASLRLESEMRNE